MAGPSRIMLRSALAQRSTIAQRPLAAVQRRGAAISIKKVVYQTSATADSKGRDGHVSLNDKPALELDLAKPPELGGDGKGNNPEQLFASGYAACFMGSVDLAAKAKKQEAPKEAKVTVHVDFGRPNEFKEGFCFAVRIETQGLSQELVDAGHALCPYSRALGPGIDIKVTTK